MPMLLLSTTSLANAGRLMEKARAVVAVSFIIAFFIVDSSTPG
jgi:hypothetical protein